MKLPGKSRIGKHAKSLQTTKTQKQETGQTLIQCCLPEAKQPVERALNIVMGLQTL
jgi:hypothetical protein